MELLNVQDVRKGLSAAIGSTWELQNTNERSRALCQLYLASLKTFEVGELERRLQTLEMLRQEKANGKVRYKDPKAI